MSLPDNIRIKNLAECPEYVPLVSEWIWQEWSRNSRAPGDVEYRTRHCLGRDNIPMTFIAFMDDKPAGTFSLWTNDLNSRQDLLPWLAVLFVLPDARGKGVGTAMQKYALEKTKALKFESLYLITDHIGYYEKAGWSFLEEAPLQSGAKTRIYRFKLTK